MVNWKVEVTGDTSEGRDDGPWELLDLWHQSEEDLHSADPSDLE